MWTGIKRRPRCRQPKGPQLGAESKGGQGALAWHVKARHCTAEGAVHTHPHMLRTLSGHASQAHDPGHWPGQLLRPAPATACPRRGAGAGPSSCSCVHWAGPSPSRPRRDQSSLVTPAEGVAVGGSGCQWGRQWVGWGAAFWNWACQANSTATLYSPAFRQDGWYCCQITRSAP